MNIEIDNSQSASRNVLFGRIFPAVITLLAVVDLLGIPFTELSDANLIPTLLSVLWIVYMSIAFARRGRHPAIRVLSIGDEWINAKCVSEARSFAIADVTAVEYEGVVNRTRVPVAGAVFPANGERILVITMRDGMELRVRVKPEHDAVLKEFATSVAPRQ